MGPHRSIIAAAGITQTPYPCEDGFAGTAPVGSFPANAFGLHDMLGNVAEWIHDCWNETYAGAPDLSEPWRTGLCGRRVLRGGSWADGPPRVRTRFREQDYGSFSGGRQANMWGLRVARTLRNRAE